jgi:hypothetical protein
MVSNIAFALQRTFAITRHYAATHADREIAVRARALTLLVRDVSRLSASSGSLKTELKLFNLDDLGEMAGLSLYSGEKLGRATMDIILVPDLVALAVREDMQYTYDFHTGKTYQLIEPASLFGEDGEFEFVYPRTSHEVDIEKEIMISLDDLKDKAIGGRFV